MNVEDRRDRAQQILARVLLVVDIGLRTSDSSRGRHATSTILGMLDLVEAVDAGLDGYPVQQVDEPPRSDRRHLRGGLGGIRQLPRRRRRPSACGGGAVSVMVSSSMDSIGRNPIAATPARHPPAAKHTGSSGLPADGSPAGSALGSMRWIPISPTWYTWFKNAI